VLLSTLHLLLLSCADFGPLLSMRHVCSADGSRVSHQRLHERGCRHGRQQVRRRAHVGMCVLLCDGVLRR
jgi:hypothetical protein